MSQMPSYSSTADMRNPARKRLPWRCTFGIVAPVRLGPMASCPGAVTGANDGRCLRFLEEADCGLHLLLASGPPLRGLLLQREPTRPSGLAVRPLPRIHRVVPLHSTDEAKATGPPAGRGTEWRPLTIFFSVRRAQRALLPLAAVLLLVLEPREQSRRRTERPELEDDLAMLRVLRLQEDAFPFVEHVDRFLERDLVVAFPFLASGEVEPLHVQEEEPPPGLPHPSLPLLHERLLRQGHGFEDGVLEGAVSDDLIAAGEDGLVRIGEDDPHLTDLIDLHRTCRTPGAG